MTSSESYDGPGKPKPFAVLSLIGLAAMRQKGLFQRALVIKVRK